MTESQKMLFFDFDRRKTLGLGSRPVGYGAVGSRGSWRPSRRGEGEENVFIASEQV